MPAASEFLKEFRPAPDAPRLPERLCARYRLDSALGHRPGGGVWLLRRREDGAPFVLKTGAGDGQDLAEEFRLLSRLPQGLGPEPVEYLAEDGAEYLVRAYLPGQTLAEAWEPGGPLEFWRETGVRLCMLLAALHRLDPPVIHRDIKPENIILSPEGTLFLTDFGIARSYKPERETDTVHMGTLTTAAPEQYGFAQSDQRTDLYALGVTLRWMLTGSYRPEDLKSACCPGWVRRFLGRAAAFDPSRRFPSAAAMASALRRHAAAKRKKRAALALAACLAVTAVIAGLPVPDMGRRPVDFGSPLLEAAVRAELDRPEGPVTREDLKEVRRLALVGQEVAGEERQLDCRLCVYLDGVAQNNLPRGDVSDLTLLSDMPNLTVLCLCRQEISDLSPLEGLPLRELYLTDNRIGDLTPLEGLEALETLYIGDNPARDLTPLSALKRLRELNMDAWEKHAPESLAPLAQLPLEALSLGNLYPADGSWPVLGTLGSLHTLWLWDPPQEALTALEGCEELRTLNLCDYGGPDLTRLPALPSLYALSVINRLPSIEGVEKQAGLGSLNLCGLEGLDLTPAASLERLREIHIFDVQARSYAPLLEIPSLERVNVDTEAALAAVEADCPGHSFRAAVS